MGLTTNILLSLLLFAAGIELSQSLRCYLCGTSESWQVCGDYRITVNCPTPQKNQSIACFEVETRRLHSNHTSYVASGCLNSSDCNTNKFCQGTASCKLDCCNTDFCNTKRYKKQSYSQQCYTCSSSKSWEDCQKHKTSVTCHSVAYRAPSCFKVEKRGSSNNHTDYAAGCVNANLCNKNYFCNGTSTCKLDCCSSKDCNLKSSTASTTVTFLLVTLAAVFPVYSLMEIHV